MHIRPTLVVLALTCAALPVVEDHTERDAA